MTTTELPLVGVIMGSKSDWDTMRMRRTCFNSSTSLANAESCRYEPIGNVHENHILDISESPASISQGVVAEAVEIACVILEELDVVGVLCVEFSDA